VEIICEHLYQKTTQGFLPIGDPKEESGSKGKKEHFLATEFCKHFATLNQGMNTDFAHMHKLAESSVKKIA
jgi:hypothetical protein